MVLALEVEPGTPIPKQSNAVLTKLPDDLEQLVLK